MFAPKYALLASVKLAILVFLAVNHTANGDLNASLNPALYVTTELSDVAVRSKSDTFEAKIDIIDESLEAELHVSYVELRPAAFWILCIHYILFGCTFFAAALGHWWLGYLSDFAFVRFRGVSALENILEQRMEPAAFCIECGEQIHEDVRVDAKCVVCAKRSGFVEANDYR